MVLLGHGWDFLDTSSLTRAATGSEVCRHFPKAATHNEFNQKMTFGVQLHEL